jgi:hypothetical protein
MNAVAVQPYVEKYDRLFRRALEGELNRWGRWIEIHSDHEGYPGVNILVAFLMGRGGGTGGHKILCLDMPTDVYAVHGRIIRLPEEQQESLWLYYVTRLKPDGTLWTMDERCRRARVSPEDLRSRLRAARDRLLGITSDEPLASGKFVK